MTGSSTVELPRIQEPGEGLGDAWRVIVLNDDHNTFDGVAAALARVIPGVTLEEGYRIADRPARAGRALLGAAERRRAHDGPARAGLVPELTQSLELIVRQLDLRRREVLPQVLERQGAGDRKHRG